MAPLVQAPPTGATCGKDRAQERYHDAPGRVRGKAGKRVTSKEATDDSEVDRKLRA